MSNLHVQRPPIVMMENAIFTDARVSHVAVRVCGYMLTLHLHEGDSFDEQKVARAIGVDLPSLSRAFDELSAAGYLTVNLRNGEDAR